MKEHEHATINKPETKPAHDEVAKKAYAIYQKEDRPRGHSEQNWLEAEAQLRHAGSDHPDHHDHHDHHAHMAADFRKRFWISLVLTLPILVLSPMLQNAGGIARSHPFSRRHLCPIRLFFGGLLVWRLAVSQRVFRGTQISSARNDDADLPSLSRPPMLTAAPWYSA